ncbi:hypothetical protein E4K10_45955 [Streptomyces sp. T1317-0309]|nr:hypothetical protein E4K10_45955 [Streptomyces sp. T1317-0309]
MHAELWTWSNDTYTVRKDLHYPTHNLVLVLRHAQNLSLQRPRTRRPAWSNSVCATAFARR